jgi:hypothetical protein
MAGMRAKEQAGLIDLPALSETPCGLEGLSCSTGSWNRPRIGRPMIKHIDFSSPLKYDFCDIPA